MDLPRFFYFFIFPFISPLFFSLLRTCKSVLNIKRNDGGRRVTRKSRVTFHYARAYKNNVIILYGPRRYFSAVRTRHHGTSGPFGCNFRYYYFIYFSCFLSNFFFFHPPLRADSFNIRRRLGLSRFPPDPDDFSALRSIKPIPRTTRSCTIDKKKSDYNNNCKFFFFSISIIFFHFDFAAPNTITAADPSVPPSHNSPTVIIPAIEIAFFSKKKKMDFKQR